MARLQIKNLLVTSMGSLTLSDRRLYNYLLHHAVGSLKKPQFSLPLTELSGVYGTGVPTQENVKISLMKLMRTQIQFD